MIYLQSKRPQSITKMNDKMNIDITIGGSAVKAFMLQLCNFEY